MLAPVLIQIALAIEPAAAATALLKCLLVATKVETECSASNMTVCEKEAAWMSACVTGLVCPICSDLRRAAYPGCWQRAGRQRSADGESSGGRATRAPFSIPIIPPPTPSL